MIFQLTPDFSKLFQLYESLYGLIKSNGPQKLCIPSDLEFYIYQQKLEMLRLCYLLRKKFENGHHQIVNVNFVYTFWMELVLQTLENN